MTEQKTVLFLLSSILLSTGAQAEPAHSCWTAQAHQEGIQVSIPRGNTPRFKNYFYQVAPGYKICYATTNEHTANPQGPYNGGATRYYFHNKTDRSTEFMIELPCAGGGIDLSWLAGGLASLYCGPSCGAKTAGIAHTVSEKSGNACGVGGKANWFKGDAVFIVYPESVPCPAVACQTSHPIPWERFSN